MKTERTQIKEMAKVLAGVVGGLAAAGQGASAVRMLSESSIGASVANNAVENNLLSREEDEELFRLSEAFNQYGELKVKNKRRAGELLTKNDYINFLIQLNQKEPSRLTEAQKSYLHFELTQISHSLNIPIKDLYNWDFSNMIKRDDTALTKYIANDIKFWNSYEGQQAKSLATGILTMGSVSGIGNTARIFPSVVVRYGREFAKFSVKHPVATEMLVTGGYKAGEISYKAYNGQHRKEGELQGDIYDAAKDVIKVPLLSKLNPWAQALNNIAVDFVYEVNKPDATDKQIKTEMVGSISAAVIGRGLEYMPIHGPYKIFINVIGGDISENKIKELYEDKNKKAEK